jgi:hypothetical protein
MQYACNKHDSELCRSFQQKKSLPLGQLIVFKGMLIGIYKSPNLFERKQFGLVFLRNFTQSQIKQKIEKRDPMSKDDSRRSFHTAITY